MSRMNSKEQIRNTMLVHSQHKSLRPNGFDLLPLNVIILVFILKFNDIGV